MLLYMAKVAPLEPNDSQPNQENIRFIFIIGFALAAKNKNKIAKNGIVFNAYINKEDAFIIYKTALALGMPLYKLNSFYNIKF